MECIVVCLPAVRKSFQHATENLRRIWRQSDPSIENKIDGESDDFDGHF